MALGLDSVGEDKEDTGKDTKKRKSLLVVVELTPLLYIPTEKQALVCI